MTGDGFARLLAEFTLSAESGDGARFASPFTEDAIYHDYIYGPHQGRADIAHMMQELFHRDAADYRWEMFDPVFDGKLFDPPNGPNSRLLNTRLLAPLPKLQNAAYPYPCA